MAWSRQMVLRKKNKIGGITLFDLKLYKEAAVAKTSRPWCKYRHADLWDKMGALTSESKHIQSISLLNRQQKNDTLFNRTGPYLMPYIQPNSIWVNDGQTWI